MFTSVRNSKTLFNAAFSLITSLYLGLFSACGDASGKLDYSTDELVDDSSDIADSEDAKDSIQDQSQQNELCLPNAVWCGVTGGLTEHPELSNTEIISFYSDVANGGASVINLPVSDTVPNYIDSIILQTGGISFNFTLDRGLWKYAPYVGTQINISGWSNEATETTEDIIDWGGVCVRYYSLTEIEMKLGLPSLTEDIIDYTNYFVTPPVAFSLSTACFDWSNFTQPSYATTAQTISIVDAVKNVTRIKFQIEQTGGSFGDVKIVSISKYADGLSAQDLILPSSSSSEAASSSSNAFAIAQSDSSYWGEISQDEWCGPCNEYYVKTGYDEGTGYSGYWHVYGDGLSSIIWPVATGNEYSDEALDPIIDNCQGLCGKYTSLNSTFEYPYVGLRFNLAGDDTTADISDQSGICVAYESTTAMRLKVMPSDSLEGSVPYAALEKATEGNATCVPFSEFNQYAGQGDSLSIEDVLKEAKSIAFEFGGAAGDTGTFNIRTFGWME